MRHVLLSSVGAKDMDKSGYQFSDLEIFEFQRKDPDLKTKTIFQPSIETPFNTSFFIQSEMGSMAQNPILIDKEQNKENPPPLPTTPVSENPTEPLC